MSKQATSLHVFRAGKHTTAAGDAIEFTAADIGQIAASYDPAVYQAPLVVGHPKTDDPAFGWVGALKANGAELFAEPAQSPPVDAEFSAMVNDGKFRNISVALWPPGHASNPKPSGYYLRHVGFLGATAPAVKGLKPAQFAGNADKLVTIEFAQGAEDESATLLAALKKLLFHKSTSEPLQPAHFSEETEMTQQATQAELDRRAAELARKEQEFAERETNAAKLAAENARKAAHASNTEFAERMAKEGRILPTQKAGVVEALTALHAAPQIEFAEGDTTIKKSPADVLREVIGNGKAVVSFAEKAPARTAAADGKVVNFKAPAGMAVDPERAALHVAALAYSEANKVDYAIAVERLQASAAT